MQAWIRLIIVSMGALVLSACGSTTEFDRYKESIAAFKTATDQTAEAVSVHILTIRQVDRERMFSQLAETRNPCALPWVAVRIDEADADPLTCSFKAIEVVREGRFSREGISVRRQAFEVLNRYTTLLAAVAESDAPARWESAAKALGASADGLAQSIGSIGPDRKSDRLDEMRKLIGNDGPLTSLVAFAGQEWINYRRSQALSSIIQQGQPAVDQISRLIREDFAFVRKRETVETDDALTETLFEFGTATAKANEDAATDEKAAAKAEITAQQAEAAQQAVKEREEAGASAAAIESAKEEAAAKVKAAREAAAEAKKAEAASKASDTARKKAVAKVKTDVEKYETRISEILSIGSAMDAFDDAHAALVAYAQSEKKPEDLAALLAVVQRYAVAAEQVYMVYQTAQKAADT